jgi:hypothetical protein
MSAPFVKFHTFVEQLAEGAYDLGADSLKIALSNTAPSHETDSVFLPGSLHPAPTEAHGYAPTQAAQHASAHAAGIYTLVLDDVVFTASGGTIGPFRYVILYDDDATSDELIAYWDYLSSITLADGETFTVDFSHDDGVLTIE